MPSERHSGEGKRILRPQISAVLGGHLSCGLCRRRRCQAELVKHRQAINVTVDTTNMVAANLDELASSHLHRTSGWGEAPKGACVSPTPDEAPNPNVIGDRVKAHRLTGGVWEASEESSKVLLETMRQGWFGDIRIAVRSVRSESSKPTIQVGSEHVST
jgi:hypothetical protein